jgi:hypothetical protein
MVAPPRSLVAQGLFEAFVRLRHLGDLAQIGSDVPFEPVFVVEAGRGIVVLRDQLLEAGGKGGLVGRAIVILQRAAGGAIAAIGSRYGQTFEI